MCVHIAHLRKNWELVWREDVKNIQRVWGIHFFEGVRPFSPIWQTLGDGHEIWQIRRLTLKKIILFIEVLIYRYPYQLLPVATATAVDLPVQIDVQQAAINHNRAVSFFLGVNHGVTIDHP